MRARARGFLASAWLVIGACSEPPARPGETDMLDARPRVSASPCRAPADARRLRALLLEREGRARAERMPFEPAEAPNAIAALSEAAHCLALAGDHETRPRVARLLAQLHAELAHRYARERILLALARRRGDLVETKVRAERLAGLLSRAGDEASAARRALSQLARHADVAMHDQNREEE